jgi:uncharacterized OsmC-like protein
MMATVETVYIGELRTKAKHLQSGIEIITDAPLDNHGKGESFSPTDLLAASLGSCMLTIMGIAARNHQFNIDGTRIEITKLMVSNPRKVSEVHVLFHMPDQTYTEDQKKIIRIAATTCLVALSINEDIKQKIDFVFND